MGTSICERNTLTMMECVKGHTCDGLIKYKLYCMASCMGVPGYLSSGSVANACDSNLYRSAGQHEIIAYARD
uniref:Uncharacterized protein n=1 Tax=Pararge aegeria TaxID=116150 RepID=S4NLV3_9NEOP